MPEVVVIGFGDDPHPVRSSDEASKIERIFT
jgi:hypothetical protein